MSRFANLEINSNEGSDNEENIVTITEVTPDDDVSVSPLTSTNLKTLGDLSGNRCGECLEQPDPLITEAHKRIAGMTANYHKVTPLNELEAKHLCNFTEYMSEKSQGFFTSLYEETEGSYQGTIASITTWTYGKNPDGSPIYLYISTDESYGSCSGCCGVISEQRDYEEFQWQINNLMKEINELYSLNTGANYKKEKADKIAKLKAELHITIAKYREEVKTYVEFIVDRLKIHRTYNEAAAEIKRNGEYFNVPKFMDAMKKAFPDKEFKKKPTGKKHMLKDFIPSTI